MFSTPLFEYLPTVLIAASIVFMVLLHSIVSTAIGLLCIVAACYMMYRRLMDTGTEPDALE